MGFQFRGAACGYWKLFGCWVRALVQAALVKRGERTEIRSRACGVAW